MRVKMPNKEIYFLSLCPEKIKINSKVMNSRIILFLTIHFNTGVYSQVIVDGVNINQFDQIKYCQVVVTGNPFKGKPIVSIDYGQENFSVRKKDSKIEDINGKPIKYHSIIGIYNFMFRNGLGIH
ncbi:MAG: hypothetical protein IPM92_12740 [Saprospiraceae bacterium]|nr:hypothetical protein [Saprospiraceae bacterium]